MLTQINFDFGHTSADGVAVLAGELVHVVPTGRFKVGKRIVVRDSFDVRLSEDGTATINVPPTDGTFAYEVTVGESPAVWRFVRCVQVPDSATPMAFADLVDVDASTLSPALNNGAALTYLLASSLQEAQAMSAANHGQMVFYPEVRAKTVASQILEDLTGARAVVESQSAQVSANAAAVQSVADSITESKTVVESHANEALTAIDEAVKSVKDKASDATVGDEAKDKTPADATTDTTSQEA